MHIIGESTVVPVDADGRSMATLAGNAFLTKITGAIGNVNFANDAPT